jgi:hypothetical protein
VTWFKRYLIGFLIAVVFFAGFDSYRHPGGDNHLATILVASAGWPVFTAFIVGGVIGDAVHAMTNGKTG